MKPCPAGCTATTPPAGLCSHHKHRRNVILTRIRVRRHRTGRDDNPETHLKSQETTLLIETLDEVMRAEQAIRDHAERQGEYIAPPVIRLMEATSLIRQALEQPLLDAEEERTERDRPR